MPVSNGQITARHIRETAIRTRHILDESVTTPKIPDLAVTFPDKINNPIWVSATQSDPFTNASLTTTPTVQVEATIDVPAWVDQVSVFAIATLQPFNTSGGTQRYAVAAYIDGAYFGGRSVDVPNGTVIPVDDVEVRNIAGVAGSSVSLGVAAWVGSGTNSSNVGRIWAMMVGHR